MLAGAGRKTKRKMRRTEQAVQGMLVRTLRLVLPRSAFVFAVPNGGWRSPIEAAIFQGQGVVAGFPDLTVLWAGRAFCMEVKSDEGRVAARQVAVHRGLRAAQVPVAIVRSLDDALTFLKAHGIPLRIKEGTST